MLPGDCRGHNSALSRLPGLYGHQGAPDSVLELGMRRCLHPSLGTMCREEGVRVRCDRLMRQRGA
eukprot:9327844-Alexandrium_andersonii.AAC.1